MTTDSRRLFTYFAAAFFAAGLAAPQAFAQDNTAADDGEDPLAFLEADSGASDDDLFLSAEEPEAEPASEPAPAPTAEVETFTMDAGEPEPAPAPVMAADDDASDDTETLEADAGEEEPSALDSRPKRATLDEIQVVAQKRAEDIQDVPLSVTAIGGEDIKEKNMADLNDVSAYAPNLSILATPTFNFIYMRGIGSGYNRGFEQSVATIIDEVYYGRPSYLSNGLLDLYAVEVLRGPQGTLFGKNSAAGALHLRTANPGDDWEFDGDALYGERSMMRFRVAGGGPLIEDHLGFRVAFMSEEQDGDIVNTTLNGRKERNLDNMNGRLKLRWEPSSSLSFQLTGNYATVDQGGSGTQLTKTRARHLAAMRVFDPQTTGDVFDDKTHQDFAGFVDRTTYDVTLTAEWDLPSGLLITNVLNTAGMEEIVEFDADFSPIPFLVLENNEDYQQISEELRFTSAPGEFEYVAGLYYFFNEVNATYQVRNFLTLDEILNLTGEGEITACRELLGPGGLGQLGVDAINAILQPCQDAALDNAALGTFWGNQAKARLDATGAPLLESSETFFDQTSNSFAAFGQATWHVTDIWSITLGGRMSYEKKEIEIDHILRNEVTGGVGNAQPGSPDFNPQGTISFPIIQAGNQTFFEARERTEFNVSPKVSTTVQWTEEIMTYATVSQGYKGGGFNAQPLNPDQVEFEEEVSNAYEVGFKSEWLGGAARFNVSGFYSTFEDLQISAFDGVSFVVTNASDATIYGVEYEWAFVPFFGLFLMGNGTYINATYDNFTGGSCTSEDTSGRTACDLSGESLTNAPEWQHTITATLDIPVFDLVRFHTGITAVYQTDMIFATDLDPIDERNELWLFGGRLGVRGMDENWHLMMFVSNIFDEKGLAGNNDVPTFRGSHFGGRIPTTEFEIEFRYSF